MKIISNKNWNWIQQRYNVLEHWARTGELEPKSMAQQWSMEMRIESLNARQNSLSSGIGFTCYLPSQINEEKIQSPLNQITIQNHNSQCQCSMNLLKSDIWSCGLHQQPDVLASLVGQLLLLLIQMTRWISPSRLQTHFQLIVSNDLISLAHFAVTPNVSTENGEKKNVFRIEIWLTEEITFN